MSFCFYVNRSHITLFVILLLCQWQLWWYQPNIPWFSTTCLSGFRSVHSHFSNTKRRDYNTLWISSLYLTIYYRERIPNIFSYILIYFSPFLTTCYFWRNVNLYLIDIFFLLVCPYICIDKYLISILLFRPTFETKALFIGENMSIKSCLYFEIRVTFSILVQ